MTARHPSTGHPAGSDPQSSGIRPAAVGRRLGRLRGLGRRIINPLTVGVGSAGIFGGVERLLLEFLPNYLGSSIGNHNLWWMVVATVIGVVVGVLHLVVRRLRRRTGASVRVPGSRTGPTGAAEIRRVAPVEPTPPPRYPADRLPPRTDPFLGRGDELAWCAETVAAGGHVLVLDSAHSVGTSRLAVEAAHRLRAGWPVVYLDIRIGERDSLTPAEVREALLAGLRRVAGARGRPAAGTLETIRQLLATTPVLLLLDNVPGAAHVAGLTDHHSGLTLIAGTDLGDLADVGTVGYLSVQPLGSADAVALLAEFGVRPTTPAEYDRALALLDAFDRLPAAVKQLAGALREGDTLERMYERVMHVAAPDDPQVHLRRIWQLCMTGYERLPTEAHRLLVLVAALPRSTVDSLAAPVLLDTGPATAGAALTALEHGGLLEPAGPAGSDRYRVPARLIPSLREHLRLAEVSDGHGDGRSGSLGTVDPPTLRRLIRFYRVQAEAYTPALTGPAPDRRHARQWLDEHEPAMYGLLTRSNAAVSRRLVRELVALARMLCRWYASPGVDEPGRWRAVARGVLSLPRLPRRGRVRCWAYIQLAAAERAAGRLYEAHRALVRARDQQRRWAPPRRGAIYTNLAVVALDAGSADALDRAWQGQQLRRHRDASGSGYANLALGAAYLVAGEPDRARGSFADALSAFSRARDLIGQGAAHHNLALIEASEHRGGARQSWRDARDAFLAAGDEARAALCERCLDEFDAAPPPDSATTAPGHPGAPARTANIPDSHRDVS